MKKPKPTRSNSSIRRASLLTGEIVALSTVALALIIALYGILRHALPSDAFLLPSAPSSNTPLVSRSINLADSDPMSKDVAAAVAGRLPSSRPSIPLASAQNQIKQVQHATILRQGNSMPQSVDAPEAIVAIDGVSHELSPNEIGSYPRYTVTAGATVPITLELSPHELVDLQTLDGGTLNTKYSQLSTAANERGNATIDFTVAKVPGSYRVLVMRSGTRSIFDFWVGPPLPTRVSISDQ